MVCFRTQVWDPLDFAHRGLCATVSPWVSVFAPQLGTTGHSQQCPGVPHLPGEAPISQARAPRLDERLCSFLLTMRARSQGSEIFHPAKARNTERRTWAEAKTANKKQSWRQRLPRDPKRQERGRVRARPGPDGRSQGNGMVRLLIQMRSGDAGRGRAAKKIPGAWGVSWIVLDGPSSHLKPPQHAYIPKYFDLHFYE